MKWTGETNSKISQLPSANGDKHYKLAQSHHAEAVDPHCASVDNPDEKTQVILPLQAVSADCTTLETWARC